MTVAYLKVMHEIGSLSFFFLGSGFLMSFHRHSCPSIMIICIQPRAVAGADAGMGFMFFGFFWATGMVPPLGVDALRKLRTLRIGSGGTGYTQ